MLNPLFYLYWNSYYPFYDDKVDEEILFLRLASVAQVLIGIVCFSLVVRLDRKNIMKNRGPKS